MSELPSHIKPGVFRKLFLNERKEFCIDLIVEIKDHHVVLLQIYTNCSTLKPYTGRTCYILSSAFLFEPSEPVSTIFF